jgi:hypothetical protein
MNTHTPVEELVAQLDLHLPIETASALIKLDTIVGAVYGTLFHIQNTHGMCFIDNDHEEMQFDDSCVNNRPEGLAEYFRLRSTVDPLKMYAHIKEPAFAAKFDVALTQSHTSTPISTASPNPNPNPTNHVLCGVCSSPARNIAHAASPALTRCMSHYYHGTSTLLVVNSYHDRVDFLGSQSNFHEVSQSRSRSTHFRLTAHVCRPT